MFQQQFDFKTKYGLDLTDEQVLQLKKIFAIANIDHSGIIGRRQVPLCLARARAPTLTLTWPWRLLRSSRTLCS